METGTQYSQVSQCKPADPFATGDLLKIKLLLAVGILSCSSAVAQTKSQTLVVEPLSPTPTFRVNVITRSVQAINYNHRSGGSKLDFEGTDLMPAATGQAKIES